MLQIRLRLYVLTGLVALSFWSAHIVRCEEKSVSASQSIDFNVPFNLEASKAMSKTSFVRKKRSTQKSCMSDVSLCRCRHKSTVICTKTNCLQRLPTTNMTAEQGARIRNIVVSRQADFRVIKPGDLKVLRNLRSARFFSNGIYAIAHSAFESTPDLERLDLHHNELSSFPRAISRLSKLRKLNLGGNKIVSIHPGSFDNNPLLEQLVLRRNRLETFPGSLPSTLLKLSIGQNMISSAGDIRYLERLKILRLDSNRFTEIRSNALPTSLRELTMCNNQLSSRRYLSVDNLKQLRRLRLAGNSNLQRITKHTFFRMASRLRELDLRQSHVVSIEGDAFSFFPRLETLELGGNELSEFQSDWFSYSKRLRGISLSGNPWNCDCDFLNQLNKFTEKIKKFIATKRKSRLIRKNELSDDFSQIQCEKLSVEFTVKKDWKSELNRNLSTINSSLCNKNKSTPSVSAEVVDAEEESLKRCTDPRTATICNNRGNCVNGQCVCMQRPGRKLDGRYCECDNTTCYRSSGKICNAHGTCNCGNCECNDGWQGRACECTLDTSACFDTSPNAIDSTQPCNGNGECECGVCSCFSEYPGQYCQVNLATTTTSTTRKPTTTTSTTRKPTTTTSTTRKPTTTTTTTRKPTTTTTTTRKPTTTTTTTRKPTTTTTTTRKPTTTTTTTRKPTTTTTTTRKPTTTTTTTRKPTTTTTTTRKPTTTTSTTRTTTTLSTTTTTTEPSSIERACTDDGVECMLPFQYQGETHYKCIPYSVYSSYNWCYTDKDGTWDYCGQCPST
ncbi:uncharacterized protein LOC143470465 [Clavelina lepadiformis]|uniref:uncharacterized protein LOC143470465 n=1 Tax=Clavelina lepadiformis TaxID=159417 RepID=UPI00404204B9